MIEIGGIRLLKSPEPLIFGPPRPWGLVHWILEGQFPGVPKTLRTVVIFSSYGGHFFFWGGIGRRWVALGGVRWHWVALGGAGQTADI